MTDLTRAASSDGSPALLPAARLRDHVLGSLKSAFVGKDEVIDLLGVSLVAGENLFILGPPGTAKSALVQQLSMRLQGRVFDYLLTRFTEPNELFGPFDIRKLREGDLITNTEGMLPEADFVFLDELLNANSAILNSLLMVLNERVFRRGRETRLLNTLMVVGASNDLPEDDALAALFDRFLLRVRCDNVSADQTADVLLAGWRLDAGQVPIEETVSVDDVRAIQKLTLRVALDAIRQPYIELVHRLRHAGLELSDRRAVKLQRLIAASAILCGRMEADVSDLWIMRYVWDTDDQREILAEVVQQCLGSAAPIETVHPRAAGHDRPDAEQLAREIGRISERFEEADLPAVDRSVLTDRLGLLESRVEWVSDDMQREFFRKRIAELWKAAGIPSAESVSQWESAT